MPLIKWSCWIHLKMYNFTLWRSGMMHFISLLLYKYCMWQLDFLLSVSWVRTCTDWLNNTVSLLFITLRSGCWNTFFSVFLESPPICSSMPRTVLPIKLCTLSPPIYHILHTYNSLLWNTELLSLKTLILFLKYLWMKNWIYTWSRDLS